MAKVKNPQLPVYEILAYENPEDPYTLGDAWRGTLTEGFLQYFDDEDYTVRKSSRGERPSQKGFDLDIQMKWREAFAACVDRWRNLPNECPGLQACEKTTSKQKVWQAKAEYGVVCSYYDLFMRACLRSYRESADWSFDWDNAWPCPQDFCGGVSIGYTTQQMSVGEKQTLTAEGVGAGAEGQWKIEGGSGELGGDDSVATALLNAINEGGTELEKIQIVEDWIEANRSAEPTLVVNQETGVEHNAYTMDIDGLVFYFDAVEPPIIAAVKEYVSGGQFSPPLKSVIEALQIVSEDSPSGPETIGKYMEGIITIFGDREVDAGIIGHEAAHGLAAYTWGDTAPAPDSAYMAAINSSEPPVSEYGATSPGEDFAEAVRLYIVDSEQLLEIAPLRYAAIKDIMTRNIYEGNTVVYFAPNENPNCDENPTISLSVCGVVCATLDIAVNAVFLWAIAASRCCTIYGLHNCSNYAYCWTGWHYQTGSACLEECGEQSGELFYNTCAFLGHPEGIRDVRTDEMKAAGCCPAVLL